MNLTWRVAVTRDEPKAGPLGSALRESGFSPVTCVVMDEHRPANATALVNAAASLEQFDWVIVSSARAVAALAGARATRWPRAVRTAAVGARTAEALVAAGADPAPLVGAGEGADALWTALSALEWTNRRVLVPTVPGGRRVLAEALRAAGAIVTEVEAYRMAPRAPERIRADWHAARPDAAVIASPSVASTLVEALGPGGLSALKAVVAIGPTTAATLAAAGVPHHVAPRADFHEAARTLAALRDLSGP